MKPTEPHLTAGTWLSRPDGTVTLVTAICDSCVTAFLPHFEECPICFGKSFTLVEEESGNLYSFTEMHVMPAGFPSPAIIGYVDLASGARCFGQFASGVALDDLKPDMAVHFSSGPVRRTDEGDWILGYTFVPTTNDESRGASHA